MTSLRSTVYVCIAVALTSCHSRSSETTRQIAEADSTEQAPASGRPAHWGYMGESGPTAWAKLSTAYALCDEGKQQSPVNIEKTDVDGGAKWRLDYKTTSLRIAHNEHMDSIIDNGHTIQVNVDEGSTFTFDDKRYDLKQFHFHTPSEHTVNGKQLPLEMHMVHQGADGSLAVIGVLFKESNVANENFAKLIAHLPNAKGESKHVPDVNIELQLHMPKDNYAYHYMGSLTTPPCLENVQWLVLREMLPLTADQIEAFSSRIGPNNRPLQSLNDRKIKLGALEGLPK